MLLEGKKTELVEIEVSDWEILKSARVIILNKNRELVPFDHTHKGEWMEFSFTDGHNGDDHYKTARKAKDTEIAFYSFLESFDKYSK